MLLIGKWYYHYTLNNYKIASGSWNKFSWLKFPWKKQLLKNCCFKFQIKQLHMFLQNEKKHELFISYKLQHNLFLKILCTWIIKIIPQAGKVLGKDTTIISTIVQEKTNLKLCKLLRKIKLTYSLFCLGAPSS